MQPEPPSRIAVRDVRTGWTTSRGPGSLSGLDRSIVELLQEDGRAPYAQLARRLGTTEKTVRRKVNELVADGVIQITAVTDPQALGYSSAALLGIRINADADVSRIAEELTAIDAVDYVVVATGRYPIWAEVVCKDPVALREIAMRRVHGIVGVQSVEVFPYLSLYYQQAQFSIARSKVLSADGVRPRSLEGIDRDIICLLSTDGRKPFKEMALELGVSQTMVRQHVRRLTSSGVLKVMCIVNPMRIGFRAVAWLAIKCAPGSALVAVAEVLARVTNVSYVAICAGRFDIFAEVVCADNTELLELLDEHVRVLPSIQEIEVAIYLDLHYKKLAPVFSADYESPR